MEGCDSFPSIILVFEKAALKLVFQVLYMFGSGIWMHPVLIEAEKNVIQYVLKVHNQRKYY